MPPVIGAVTIHSAADVWLQQPGQEPPFPWQCGASPLSSQSAASNSHSAHILQHCTDIFAIMQFKCTLVIPTSTSNSVDTWWSSNSIPISRTQLKPTISVIYTSTHCPFSASINAPMWLHWLPVPVLASARNLIFNSQCPPRHSLTVGITIANGAIVEVQT